MFFVYQCFSRSVMNKVRYLKSQKKCFEMIILNWWHCKHISEECLTIKEDTTTHYFQCFDFSRLHAHPLKIRDCLKSKNLRLLLEKVSFYSILLNVFVRFYRNFEIITLHRFQITYQNLILKFDLDPQEIATNLRASS